MCVHFVTFNPCPLSRLEIGVVEECDDLNNDEQSGGENSETSEDRDEVGVDLAVTARSRQRKKRVVVDRTDSPTSDGSESFTSASDAVEILSSAAANAAAKNQPVIGAPMVAERVHVNGECGGEQEKVERIIIII